MLILKQHYLTQSHKAVSEYSKQVLLVNLKLTNPCVFGFFLSWISKPQSLADRNQSRSITVFWKILFPESAIAEKSIWNDTNNKERALTQIFQFLSDRWGRTPNRGILQNTADKDYSTKKALRLNSKVDKDREAEGSSWIHGNPWKEAALSKKSIFSRKRIDYLFCQNLSIRKRKYAYIYLYMFISYKFWAE